MKRVLVVFTAIIWSSCVKNEKHASRPLIALPYILQYSYDHFPSTDTLFTTGVHGNSIGFVFWDRNQALKWSGVRVAILQELMIMSVAKVCYKKAFGDSINIEPDILQKYSLKLQVLTSDGAVIAQRQWPLDVIAHH